MKKIYLLLSMILVYATVFSQSLSPTLVGSAGDETDNATYQTSWSIGEAITQTASAGSYILTQGFQQGFSPITISGPTNLCVNSGYYNYSTQPGMTAYTWTISSGGTITWGGGTYQIQVIWTGTGPQTVSVNYTSTWGFRPPSPVALNVTVNALPGPAGTISGTPNVCAGANGIAYSVASIANATSYVWTLPQNATITSGTGTNSITVNFGSNAVSGNIYVYGNSACGNGASSPAFAVTVTQLPAPAGTITGEATICGNPSGIVYSVATIANATGYNWTVPTGVVIVSGANTQSITVNYTSTAVSGNITVLGTNSCGNGTVSPNFAVTVSPIPAAPVVTNTGDTVHSSAPSGNQWYFQGTLIVGATSQNYVATQTGYYWDIVTINGCSSAESNHIRIFTTGIDSHPTPVINVYPVPNDGRFNVSFTTPSEEFFTISVYTNLGVKIHEEANVEVNGTEIKEIDLRPVPNGVYTVIFENGTTQIVKKIVVNK